MKLIRYSGTGNTFVLTDNRSGAMVNAPDAAREWCARFGVDGLLAMENAADADVRMRILNPDGSEASMCGNGSRCAAHWAHHKAGIAAGMKIETGAGILAANVEAENVRVRLTDPRGLRTIEGLRPEGALSDVVAIDTGVPHAVTRVAAIEAVDVEVIGKAIRNDAVFQPAGANASFFAPEGAGRIRCRVYERGVEHETQSCGTGSTACALIAALQEKWESPVEVRVQSGDTLRIHFRREGDSFFDVWLDGTVECLGVLNA